MRVFIGSSSQAEQAGDVRLLAEVLQEAVCIPEPWSAPGTLIAGTELWSSLMKKAVDVDGAAFIFREDDQIQTVGVTTSSVRDNVLLEFGLFSGILYKRFGNGTARCVIFKRGSPKIPTDLHGITHISLDNSADLFKRVAAWAHIIKTQPKPGAALETKQIGPIIQAMRRSGVNLDDIGEMMRSLGALPIEIQNALQQRPSSRRTRARK